MTKEKKTFIMVVYSIKIAKLWIQYVGYYRKNPYQIWLISSTCGKSRIFFLSFATFIEHTLVVNLMKTYYFTNIFSDLQVDKNIKMCHLVFFLYWKNLTSYNQLKDNE